MRSLACILLLVAPLCADPLVTAGVVDLAGNAVALAPFSVRNRHLPAVIVDVARNRSQIVVFGRDRRSIYSGVLQARATAMASVGGIVYVGQRQADTASLLALRSTGRSVTPIVYGIQDLARLRNPRLLKIVALGNKPWMVFAHDAGVLLSHPERGRGGAAHQIAVPGRRFLGATDAFDANGDRQPDLFLLSGTGRLVRLEPSRPGGPMHVSQDYPYTDERVSAKTIFGSRRQVWLGGVRGRNAALLLFDPLAKGAVHRFKDIFKDDRGAHRDPIGIVDLGPGAVTSVQAVDENLLAVAGTRKGRAWLGVMNRSGRVLVLHEAYLSGTQVTAFCVNPSRRGWTFAAATNARKLHLLRLSSDKDEPAPEIPAPRPEPKPEPKPEPRPEPQPRPERFGAAAYFPNVIAESRRGRNRLDTTIYILYLGTRAARISVRFHDETGKVVVSTFMSMRRGQRGKIVLSRLLSRDRIPDLDGYAVVSGAERRDLIVSASLYRDTSGYESVLPTWR